MRTTILAIALIALIGCQRTASPPGKEQSAAESSTQAKKRGTIGVSLLTLENPFFKVIGDNIQREAAKAGYDVLLLSADENAAKQSDQIANFVQRKVSAIVLSPCEARAIVPALQEANKADIPVFTVDIPCHEPNVDIVCQIATDNVDGGRKAAQAMIEAIGESGGKIAILNFPSAESCRMRVQGFREVLNKHNETAKGKFDVVVEVDGKGSKEGGKAKTENVLQTHPDLRGVFAINDPSALGAYVALEQAKRTDIKIVGFDGQPEGLEAIKAGHIVADPVQFPDRMGVEVVNQFKSWLNGVVPPKVILIPTHLYYKDGIRGK